MTKSVLIHNPRCSKSRGAKEILEEKGVHFDVVNYLQGELTEDLLSKLPQLLQMEFSEFIRANEEIYKELKLSERYPGRQEWIKILKEHPILLERPIFIHHEKAIIGRPPERVLEIVTPK